MWRNALHGHDNFGDWGWYSYWGNAVQDNRSQFISLPQIKGLLLLLIWPTFIWTQPFEGQYTHELYSTVKSLRGLSFIGVSPTFSMEQQWAKSLEFYIPCRAVCRMCVAPRHIFSVSKNVQYLNWVNKVGWTIEDVLDRNFFYMSHPLVGSNNWKCVHAGWKWLMCRYFNILIYHNGADWMKKQSQMRIRLFHVSVTIFQLSILVDHVHIVQSRVLRCKIWDTKRCVDFQKIVVHSGSVTLSGENLLKMRRCPSAVLPRSALILKNVSKSGEVYEVWSLLFPLCITQFNNLRASPL